MASASQTEVFNCSVEQFYDLLVDYGKYSEFLSEVTSATVLSEDGDSKDVEFKVFMIKNVSYINRQTEKRPTEVSWKFLKGDVFKAMSGSWQLEDDGGKTKATYSVEAKFGFLVPKAVTKILLEKNLPNMMKSYHNRVSQLYG